MANRLFSLIRHAFWHMRQERELPLDFIVALQEEGVIIEELEKSFYRHYRKDEDQWL